ncbi:MAG: hypothetical protein Alpg2KO_33800 [Alphaproteobacteria bacterium]
MGAVAAIAVTVAPHSGANAFFKYDAEMIESLEIVGSDFESHLAKEYQTLSLFERDEMTDWRDAESYADRAISSAAGNAPLPYDPSQGGWRIHREGQLDALMAGRSRLMTVLNAGARGWYPRQAAIAQSRYDCWVEQEEEGWQLDHIADCRKEFIYWLRWIEANMNGNTVYFDFDSSSIRPSAAAKLDALAEQLDGLEDVGILVVGHTDTVDTRSYNNRLGMARAEAVKQALMDRGVAASIVNQMRLRSMGEEELAVDTGDGVREQANRRAIILRDDRQ